MGAGNEETGDEILFPGRHAGAALAAAALRPIGRERHALDVAGMGHGHHHVLALDEILILQIRTAFGNLGPPRGGELISHFGQLVADDPLDPFP